MLFIEKIFRKIKNAELNSIPLNEYGKALSNYFNFSFLPTLNKELIIIEFCRNLGKLLHNNKILHKKKVNIYYFWVMHEQLITFCIKILNNLDNYTY